MDIEYTIKKIRYGIALLFILPVLFFSIWSPDIAVTLAEETAEKTTLTIADLMEAIQFLSDLDWDEISNVLGDMPTLRDLNTPTWPELEEEPIVWEEVTQEALLLQILDIPEWKLLRDCDNWYYEEFLDSISGKYPGILQLLKGDNVFSLLISHRRGNRDVIDFLLLAHQMKTGEYGLPEKIRLCFTCGFTSLYAKFCATRGEYSYYIVYTPLLLILLIWLYRKVPIYKKAPYSEQPLAELPAASVRALPVARLHALPPGVHLNKTKLLWIVPVSCRSRNHTLLALPPHKEKEENALCKECPGYPGRDPDPHHYGRRHHRRSADR